MAKLSVLIVEDSERKLAEILRVFQRDGLDGRLAFTSVTNIVDAKRCLRNAAFDLLLVDIQIPETRGSHPIRDGGLHLLRMVLERRDLNSPPNIIGLTAYPDIFLEVKDRFENSLSAILQVTEDGDEWRRRLFNRVKYLTEARIEISAFRKRDYDYDVAVLCALQDTEFDSFLSVFPGLSDVSRPNDPASYYVGRTPGADGDRRIVATFCREMGLTAATALATKVIISYAPRYVFMTGIAAGVRGRVGLGDVIVADPSWDYGSGKFEDVDGVRRFSPAPSQVRLDAELVTNLRRLRKDEQLMLDIRNRWNGPEKRETPQLQIGPMASGPAVVSDASMVKEIEQQQRKLLGIDMEAYGLFWAAANSIKPNPTICVMKGVSDFADSSKDDSQRAYAAFVSNSLLREYIRRFI